VYVVILLVFSVFMYSNVGTRQRRVDVSDLNLSMMVKLEVKCEMPGVTKESKPYVCRLSIKA